MNSDKIMRFAASVFVCFSAAAVGSAFTMSQITTWYATLYKPAFNPPNWIFGPVWTILYVLMAISLYLVWSNKTKRKGISLARQKGIGYFFIQLICNSLWSIVFFGLHAPMGAFLVIIALWIFIFLTMRNFSLVVRSAGQLLIPYLAWVSFALILNFSVVLLN